MRYYDITITDPNSGKVIKPKWADSLGLDTSYTSYVNGQTLSAALDIELNLRTYRLATPQQGSFVRIYGIGIEEISQSADLENMEIVVKGGMQKGLPLARPEQSGVIAKGKIYQAIGNWQGIDKTLDLILTPFEVKPKNFVLIWKRNAQLSDGIKAAIQGAYPNLKVTMAISDKLVAPADFKAQYKRFEDFATAVKKATMLSLFSGITTQSGQKYGGVDMTMRGNDEVIVYDGTSNYSKNSYDNPKTIDFLDLVGQPGWAGPTIVNIKTVMRADIWVGDYIKLPEKLSSPYVLTPNSAAFPNAPSRNKLIFQGVFKVNSVYQWGRYRQTSAGDWVTTFEIAPVKAPSTNNQSLIAKAFEAPTGTTVVAPQVQAAFNAPTGTIVT